MGFTPNSGIPPRFILSCFPDRTMPSEFPFRSSHSWAVTFLSACFFRDEVACTCPPDLTWTQGHGSTPSTASERGLCGSWQRHVSQGAVHNILLPQPSRTDLRLVLMKRMWFSIFFILSSDQSFLFLPLESRRVALLPLFFSLSITMYLFSPFVTLTFVWTCLLITLVKTAKHHVSPFCGNFPLES